MGALSSQCGFPGLRVPVILLSGPLASLFVISLLFVVSRIGSLVSDHMSTLPTLFDVAISL